MTDGLGHFAVAVRGPDAATWIEFFWADGPEHAGEQAEDAHKEVPGTEVVAVAWVPEG